MRHATPHGMHADPATKPLPPLPRAALYHLPGLEAELARRMIPAKIVRSYSSKTGAVDLRFIFADDETRFDHHDAARRIAHAWFVSAGFCVAYAGTDYHV